MKGLFDDQGSGLLDDRADLIPMIDCVFLMLLFFVVTATFSDQSLFDIELPTSTQAEVRDTTSATVISVSRTGGYAIGQDPIPEGGLGPELRRRQEAGLLSTVVIQGDKACPYERIVSAVDAARASGATELAFAVAQ